MRTNKNIISLVAVSAIFASVNVGADEIFEPTGLDQINEIIAVDARLKKKVSQEDILVASKAISKMNSLIKEAIIAKGLANDDFISVADTIEINDYLVQNHSNEWYELRGQNADEDSTGYYIVDRKRVRTETTVLNSSASSVWGKIYNLGFESYDKKRLSNYTGSKSSSFASVGYSLGEIMKDDVASGTLDNPDFQEVAGTTDTSLDKIVNIILQDKGLLRKISTGDMREGAKSADGMNNLIKEAIIEEGLGNDGKLTTADIRQINNYLVANYQEEWLILHGDDENGEETGYHLVQNDGAYTRMFADNVMNSVADGVYHLGFETNKKNRLLNEDGNANKSFEKVAWWLDTVLKTDLETGMFSNPDYQEVVGTTGTTFDMIVPYIYNDEGLLLKVSMQDIREGAKSANAMNELIVEAIKYTGVASDDYISSDEVKTLNEYLVSNYASEWIELHGDDESDEETGYHSIQNNGARGIAYNKNIINKLADGIYHLGFATSYKNRLVNEDGKKNVTFKNVSYWLNKSLKDDYAGGVFK